MSSSAYSSKPDKYADLFKSYRPYDYNYTYREVDPNLSKT